ncbi:MAG: RNA polymerase sigma factor [Pseudomonadota bacterium]
MESTVEEMVFRARRGDKEALERLLESIKNLVFGLALRMLGRPADAEDAGQEILIKVITHLAEFRGESAFSTWVYRIASNHLLSARKRRSRNREISFDEYAAVIDDCLDENPRAPEEDAEYFLRLEEMWISCTQGMLLCLNGGLRLAYILGEVFHLDGETGAAVMGLSPAAFRKRLSRARELLFNFMKEKCSLVNPENPCTCPRQAAQEKNSAGSAPAEARFTGLSCRARNWPEVQKRLAELDQLQRVGEIFRSHPEYRAPEALTRELKSLIDSGTFGILTAH